jgi:hypothetical protein
VKTEHCDRVVLVHLNDWYIEKSSFTECPFTKSPFPPRPFTVQTFCKPYFYIMTFLQNIKLTKFPFSMHPFKKTSLLENITKRPLFLVKGRFVKERFVDVPNIEQSSFASPVKRNNK